MQLFFSLLLFVIRVPTEKFSYFVRQFRRQFIYRAMKRASVNYAFVRRVHDMKRMSVNFSFAESFACIQCETSSTLSIYGFCSPRTIEGMENSYINGALNNDLTVVYNYSRFY